MGISKHGDKYIMRAANRTDEIESCTLGELLEWIQDLVERNGKDVQFELSAEENATVYYHIERPATVVEIEKFNTQQEAIRLKTEARERADYERLQAKFAPKTNQ